MRLRLIIQRHSLPPVQLLWTVGDSLSPFTPEPAATISQFLEQVNEIIPLESEDWGLEDYVVEVRSFECLHFSELSHIFREDDEVRVRPLQTSDLRFRKVSGRHQISADGKHLIDGVAFGRPFLRRTARPPIRIPPRKRRRITYDDDSNDIFDEHANYQQVAVHAGPDDLNNISPNEDSVTDDEYSPDEEVTNELFMELKDIRDDDIRNTGEDHFSVAEDPEIPSSLVGAIVSPRRLTRSRKAGGLCLEGEEMLKLVDENGRPYPGEYNNPLLDLYLYGDDEPRPRPDMHETKRRRTSSPRGIVERATEKPNIEPERVNRRNSKSNWKGVRFQDANLETPATVQEFEESDQSDYEVLYPFSDMTPSLNESDKENSEPRYEATELNATRNRKPSATSSASSEPESGDKDFSFHSSTASTSSDPSFEQLASPLNLDAVAGASEKSSGLSSDSDHPSLEVIKPSAPQHGEKVDFSETGSVGRLSPNLSDIDIKVIPIVSKFQAPYTGKVATRKRNQRRRDSKKLKRLKLRGLLSPNLTIEDYHRMQAREVTAKEPSDDQSEKSQEEASDGHTAFDVKREYLLRAIASGGIDTTHDALQEHSSSQDMGDSAKVDETALDDGKKMVVDDKAEISDRLQRKSQTDLTPAGESAHRSLDETAVLPDNFTDLLNEINRFVGETEAPPHGDKTAANQRTTPDEVEISPDYIITPNGSDALPDDTLSLPFEIAAEINTAVKNLQSPERLKLDVSSSKRMVFGSLGVRVPKTKEDEAKLTAKLMKDVRPLQVFRTKEPSEVSEPSVTKPNKNDNSWKDKIELMAVECCEEGIELSTPSFPFVQRWDPQQRKKPKNGCNSRRDKKRKRNDDHYYTEKPGLSAGEDTYISGPSASFGPEAPATGPVLGKQDQSASRTENNEYEDVSNEKSQSEADGPVPVSADGGGVPDLPSLPDEMSTCLSLTEAITMPGTIIAFKQLDMSKETNWQPKISDYRTAVVNCLKDDGTLRMILARRDQPKKEELYDQHTGERVYSKFEMPGFDEDAEEPGGVEISFSELIEPKLVQAANFQSAKQQFSTHDGDHSPPDMDVETAMKNNLQSSPTRSQRTDLELPDVISTEGRKVGAIEGVRQEIFDLIKEAGWRSSVRSSNEDDQRSEQNLPPSPNQPFSPNQPALEDSIYREEENPDQGPSEQFNGFNSSPPGGKSLEPSDQRSSKTSVADSPQSQHVFEVAETVPVHRNTVPNTPTKNPFDNGDEAVDVKEEDYEGLMWSEPQYQPEADHQMSSQELSSQKPMPESVVRPAQHEGQNSKVVSSPAEPSMHDVSSDNEFPTLEIVFSQVRSSQAKSSQGRPSLESRVSDDDLTYIPKSSFESTTTKGRDSQKGIAQNSESSGEANFSQKQTLFKWEDSDEVDQTASPRPVQPQIVDLTLPSDPTDAPDDSDYVDDGTQLPVGPGWVKKTRATSSRLGSLKPGEGRSMRSRSRSVY